MSAVKLIFSSVRVHVNFLTCHVWFVWPLWGILLCELVLLSIFQVLRTTTRISNLCQMWWCTPAIPAARKQVLRQKEQRKSDVSLSHLTSARSGRNIVRSVSVSKMKLLFWWNYPTVPPYFYKRAEKELSPWFSTFGTIGKHRFALLFIKSRNYK